MLYEAGPLTRVWRQLCAGAGGIWLLAATAVVGVGLFGAADFHRVAATGFAGEAPSAGRANADHATDTPTPVGHFVAWPGTRVPSKGRWTGGTALLRPDQRGRWVAVVTQEGRLRVWELRAQGRLGQLVWDTGGQDYVVGDIAWAGKYLVYWKLKGVRNFLEFERADVINPDPNRDFNKYIRDNSQTWLWDPESNTERVLINKGSGTLLTDKSGDTLVLCDATFTHDDPSEDRWLHTIVNVYSMPDGALRDSFAARIEYHMLGGYLGGHILPHPLFNDAGPKAFFARGTTRGLLLPGYPFEMPLDALTLVGLDGSVRFVTDGTTSHFLTDPPGLPAVVALEDGREAVACMLERWRQVPWRLAFFGVDGQRIREYSFGLRYAIVEKSTGRKTNWRPITVTPEGKHLLLHDTGERDHLRTGEAGWLWMWNLEEKQGKPVARLPKISAVYGWVHEEYLLLELGPAAGADVAEEGALYVPWNSGPAESANLKQSRAQE